MKTFLRTTSVVFLTLFSILPSFSAEVERVTVKLGTSGADQVLVILAKHQHSQPFTDADWDALFANEPYKRLKMRKTAMQRPFTDQDFTMFVLSDELAKEYDELPRTLAEGPDVAPIRYEQPEVQSNWDLGMKNFDQDLGILSEFFLQVLDGRLKQMQRIKKLTHSLATSRGLGTRLAAG